MNISESIAAQTVVSWAATVLLLPPPAGVVQALAALADRSSKTLAAGVDGAWFRAAADKAAANRPVADPVVATVIRYAAELMVDAASGMAQPAAEIRVRMGDPDHADLVGWAAVDASLVCLMDMAAVADQSPAAAPGAAVQVFRAVVADMRGQWENAAGVEDLTASDVADQTAMYLRESQRRLAAGAVMLLEVAGVAGPGAGHD
ncbi:MAG: hypothetical protein LBE08_02225 [Bifidobacteriaceae bacterium]|nr:hypothetical protein [Bifidobacteriaceae bacterium]